MKNRILSFALLFLLIGFAAQAQIVRVTNEQNMQTLFLLLITRTLKSEWLMGWWRELVRGEK